VACFLTIPILATENDVYFRYSVVVWVLSQFKPLSYLPGARTIVLAGHEGFLNLMAIDRFEMVGFFG
jgi:hypothetical protein